MSQGLRTMSASTVHRFYDRAGGRRSASIDARSPLSSVLFGALPYCHSSTRTTELASHGLAQTLIAESPQLLPRGDHLAPFLYPLCLDLFSPGGRFRRL